ncbi:MAG TPA: lipid kinase [Woeseiaceae bacterium]|nr:lipid kinase [Woeseiaceae bacterium]
MSDRTLLLVNSHSRRGDMDREWLVARLKENGPVLSPECSDQESMRRAIVRFSNSVGRIVIGGGDGTLNGALPALLETAVPLGVLPLGTANDFARSLAITDVSDAVDIIVSGHTRKVDVGTVNGTYFLNAVSIGLGPRINSDLDAGTKSRLGVFAYLVHALRNAQTYRGMRAIIECDGEAISVRSIQITIGNGIHYGGGMTISTDARLDDGLLRVLSIRPQSVASLLTYGPAIKSGKLEDDENLQTFAGREVIVRTRHETTVTADGEEVARTPIECHSLHQALTVFARDRDPGPGAGHA